MNLIHRLICRSSGWKKTLDEKILPWALKEIELGDDVLEVGPGPGLTTDILRHRFARMTCIEIDRALAERLARRMQGTNVTVVQGDATRMRFETESFSGAVSFTMLHHVPSSDLQDRLLREVHRVLRPGGMFAGTDSTWSRLFELLHLRDTMVVVDPATLGERLEKAGFKDVKVDVAKGAFRFRARRA